MMTPTSTPSSGTPAGPAPAPAGPRGSGARLAALDGLRGLALAGMLAWHAEVGWVRGGFARMTVFFVLAGFLAARSLERQRTRGASRPFLTFWRRRVFRLLPMTLVGVAWALAVTAAIGGSRARRTATGDALSVLSSTSNWRFILDDRPYAALFEVPNAFQHYWSLSVEEQCFLLLPLVLALAGAAAGVGRRRGTDVRPRRTATVLAVASAALSAIPLVVPHAPDAAYYGTHVRLGEFVAGVALAVALSGWSPQGWSAARRKAVDAIGVTSLAVLLIVMLTISRDQEWLYRGGMGVFSVPTAALIAAVATGAPVTSRILGVAPVAALGRWAFSIYVLHWPLFQLINRAAPHLRLEGAALQGTKVSAAVAVGALGYTLLEQPLMSARGAGGTTARPWRWWARDRVAARVLAAGVVACVAAALAVPQREPVIDLEAAVGQGPPALSAEDAERILASAETPDVPVFRNPQLAGVALFGGSGALTLALAAQRWAVQVPTVETVPGYSPLGCGLITRGEHRGHEVDQAGGDERVARPPADCLDWTKRWPAVVKANRVDVAVVVSSTFDLFEWRLDDDADQEWRAIGDPLVDRVLDRSLNVAADSLHAVGAREVVLVTAIEPPEGAASDERRQRAAAYNEIVRTVARSRHDVRLVDLGGWTAGLHRDEFARLLPDGVHTTPQTGAELWDGWLGDAVETAVPLIPRRSSI